ncbi:MAG: tRNA 2-thiouridine(34) synthase MnmA [Candidatus Sericytochromatia bacterium]
MKIAVAMSGGVDSAVAAALLRRAGHEVVGVSMVSWRRSLCCSFEDVAQARLLARQLGIKHYLIDLMDPFHQELVQPYVEARLQGLTPNPCPACNRDFKLGRMWEALLQRVDVEALATGHYARQLCDPVSRRQILLQARDRRRDQSYMLWSLSQEQLQRTLFPLGELSKPEVRALAVELGMEAVAHKPDSQDLCFLVPDQATFWQEQAAGRYAPGEIINASGQVLGQHKGLVFYTPGQRRGLGIAGAERLYVSDLDPEQNRLVVGPPAQVNELYLTQLNWLSVSAQALDCQAQLRLHGLLLPARLLPDGDGARLCFAESISQVACGQSAVCYDGDGRLLAGGVVSPPKSDLKTT